MLTMSTDPYASGVLKEAVHGRLVQDIANYARDAAIQPHWIWQALSPVQFTSEEISFIRRFRFHAGEGCSGLVYTGNHPELDPEDRMSAIAGALLRNFVRARVATVNEVVADAERNEVPDVSALLIPNFFAKGQEKPKWKVGTMLDVLLTRRQMGLQTILHVSDMHGMSVLYGDAMKRHLEKHYRHYHLG